jgi:CHAT domain-containing protein
LDLEEAVDLERLGKCSIAHVAYHGWVNILDPAKGLIILGRFETEDLTIHGLNGTPPKHESGQIAYLFACLTADIRVRILFDESIHLASRFQLIGFKHVIRALLEADDSAAIKFLPNFISICYKMRSRRVWQ